MSKATHVESDLIPVRSEYGLHARPAALIAATARRFASDIRIIKGERDANGRSIVSIMGLEVGPGDEVRLVVSGPDAVEAAKAIAQVIALDVAHTESALVEKQQRAASTVELGAFAGIASSPGIAIGRVYQLRTADMHVTEHAADPAHERRELENAIAQAHVQLEVLQARIVADGDVERAAIFAAHEELLEDPALFDEAAELIRAGKTAAYAWRAACRHQAALLVNLQNPVLAGRAADVRDVMRRILNILVGHPAAHPELPRGCIIITEDLTPSEAATLDRGKVNGFCTTTGSATSHVAILARALGIPALTGIDPRALDIDNGTTVILDGDVGVLRTDPSAAAIADAESKRSERAEAAEAALAVADEPAVTLDGRRVEIVANIGGEAEAVDAVSNGAEGVGLLRTEFMFLDRHDAPTEDEQAAAYEAIARRLGRDRILVVRCLDVGGDKPVPYLSIPPETNPFLGERGIRMLLNRPEIMRTQIRAALRASASGRVAIMFPMVATLHEWKEARRVVEEERESLKLPEVQVGIMVETASAALLADRFAEDADFFSIGTNDLTQYTLAMERGNPRLAPSMDALHPAVLRLIDHTVRGAHAHKRWVGVCGALASDPDAVPILLGLGVDELSVSVPAVPAIKARVRELSMMQCMKTARDALDASDAAEVRAIVAHHHEIKNSIQSEVRT